MKPLTLLLLFSLLFLNNIFPQKTIKKVSKEVCECLEKKSDEFTKKEVGDIVNECIEPSMMKHKSKLKSEFGIDVDSGDDSGAAYNFGVEVAKVLMQDCETFMELITEQQSNENTIAENYYNEAEELVASGKNEEALALYEKAIQLVPDNHQYYNSRGILFFKKNDYYRAISDFMKATEVNPQFALGYYNLAYTKHQMSDNLQAYNDIKTALKLDTTYCDSYNLMGLIQNELEINDSCALSFQGASHCDTLDATYAFNAGYVLYTNKMYEEALVYFLRAYRNEYVNNFRVLNYIGNSYDNSGNYEKAIEYHSLSIQVNDSSYIGYYNRATTNYNFEKYKLALPDFLKASELDSTDADIYLYLGRIYEKLEKNDMAEMNYGKAIELNSANAVLYDSRALFYENTGQHLLSIEDSKSSLVLYPDDCTVYLSIGRNYRKLNKEKEATEAINKSKELGCEDADE